jgi:hypothetical protein
VILLSAYIVVGDAVILVKNRKSEAGGGGGTVGIIGGGFRLSQLALKLTRMIISRVKIDIR